MSRQNFVGKKQTEILGKKNRNYILRKEIDGKKYVRYEVIGANHVAVPTHFYKIIVGEKIDGTLEMEAFVMPNTPIDDNSPLTNFQVDSRL